MVLDVILAIVPLLLAVFVLAFVVDLVQVKWKPTLKPLEPKFDKFNPINGVKRMFSVRTIIQLLKSIAIIEKIYYYIIYNIYGCVIWMIVPFHSDE